MPPLINKEGFVQSNTDKKAEILNIQFDSNFTKEDISHIPNKGPSPYSSMEHIQVQMKGAEKLLLNLKPHKATGPDSISTFILKSAAHELAPILTRIYQTSLNQGEVPQDWREALVVPIFKKRERHLPGNSRPASLTSFVRKMLKQNPGRFAHFPIRP